MMIREPTTKLLTVLIVAMLCTLLAAPRADNANACFWDSDTLRAEANGLPGVAEIIVGRFDRFPPLYYEMRLERAASDIAANPDDLDAYDDAAVAADRLHRSDEAVEWMERKAAALDRLEADGADTAEHRYRYLANLGTIVAHRWIRDGVDRENLTDLERSRDLISDAIELNPNAHFGRERYQLLAIDWLLNPPDPEPYDFVPLIFHADPKLAESWHLGFSPSKQLTSADYADAVEGLAGLIALGNAWQSVDILHALTAALADREDTSLALLASLRRTELLSNGNSTMHPLAPDHGWLEPTGSVFDDQVAAIRAYFPKARAEAEAWRNARNEYALARMNRGEHPDTHPEFWSQWREPSRMPAMPNGLFGLIGYRRTIAIGLAVSAAFLITVYWLWKSSGSMRGRRSTT